MSSLGKVVSGSGKHYQLFTFVKEAWDYVADHGGREKYGVKTLTVYGVYLKPKSKRSK